ncbi:hypothetical protein CEXT_437141 [Caerostris extrusa]|uniref:Uncharacterized protein n=1 Tax=Caerostris extrusa TaxID=172846 RepID=A0AAV4Y5F9_CAEEX|nr:hypothetical protein CEXT_437141 [Caerostris extrusa]
MNLTKHCFQVPINYRPHRKQFYKKAILLRNIGPSIRKEENSTQKHKKKQLRLNPDLMITNTMDQPSARPCKLLPLSLAGPDPWGFKISCLRFPISRRNTRRNRKNLFFIFWQSDTFGKRIVLFGIGFPSIGGLRTLEIGRRIYHGMLVRKS